MVLANVRTYSTFTPHCNIYVNCNTKFAHQSLYWVNAILHGWIQAKLAIRMFMAVCPASNNLAGAIGYSVRLAGRNPAHMAQQCSILYVP